MSAKSTSLASESVMMLLSSVGAGVFLTLISIFVARSVSVASYGIYSIVISIQAVAAMFASLNIGTALTKYIAEHRARRSDQTSEIVRVGATLVLIVAAITSIVYVALGEPLGGWLYHENEVTRLIPFSAFVVLSTAAFATMFGIVQGFQRIRLLAYMKCAGPMVSFILVLVLLDYAGLRGIFLAVGSAQLAVTASAYYWLRRGSRSGGAGRVRLKESKFTRMILGYSVPMTISASLVGPVYWLGNTDLAISTGFDAVGLFGIAFIVFQGLAVLPNSISIPLMPRVSNFAVDSIERVRTMVMRSLKATMLFIFPIAFGVGLFAEQIIDFFFGSDYSQAGQSVYLMALAGFFFAQGVIVGALMAGLGRVWLGLSVNLVWAASFLAMAVLWIPPWAEVGLAASFAVSYLLLAVISFVLCETKLDISLRETYLLWTSVTILAGVAYLGVSGAFELGWAQRVALLALGCIVVAYLERSLIRELWNRGRISSV